MLKFEFEESDKYWDDFLYSVCDGNASEMVTVKKFDIMDFFNYIDNKSKKRG